MAQHDDRERPVAGEQTPQGARPRREQIGVVDHDHEVSPVGRVEPGHEPADIAARHQPRRPRPVIEVAEPSEGTPFVATFGDDRKLPVGGAAHGRELDDHRTPDRSGALPSDERGDRARGERRTNGDGVESARGVDHGAHICRRVPIDARHGRLPNAAAFADRYSERIRIGRADGPQLGCTAAHRQHRSLEGRRARDVGLPRTIPLRLQRHCEQRHRLFVISRRAPTRSQHPDLLRSPGSDRDERTHQTEEEEHRLVEQQRHHSGAGQAEQCRQDPAADPRLCTPAPRCLDDFCHKRRERARRALEWHAPRVVGRAGPVGPGRRGGAGIAADRNRRLAQHEHAGSDVDPLPDTNRHGCVDR